MFIRSYVLYSACDFLRVERSTQPLSTPEIFRVNIYLCRDVVEIYLDCYTSPRATLSIVPAVREPSRSFRMKSVSRDA